MAASKTRECPFCKEQILIDAIKCKHCSSALEPDKPTHAGTCPYCKEQIHKEAVKCKHCYSYLLEGTNSQCNCSGQGALAMARGVGVYQPPKGPVACWWTCI